jgi:hypothetical protein
MFYSWFIGSVIVFLKLSLMAQNGGMASKFFENVTLVERRSIIAAVAVTNDEWLNKFGSIDVVDELNRNCRGLATYRRLENGQIERPTVKCIYRSDKNLDGMTPKFKCEFLSDNGQPVKVKIKYAKNLAGSAKEIAPAILGSGLSNLLGFVSDTYCPAVVICEGCNSDPWSRMQRSSAPALVNVRHTFDYAVVEVKVEGLKVSEPRKESPKPQGLAWAELANVSQTLSLEQKHILLAEREALMLWMNFIYHTDADAHNNRLLCQQWSEIRPDRFRCEKSVGYAHDYGDSFAKMNFSNFKGVSVFLTSYFRWPALWGKKCVGSLDRGEGAIKQAVFSEEARSFLVERFSQISHIQLKDYLALAKVDRLSGHSLDEWTEVINNKLAQITEVRCESLNSRNTVLTKSH